MVQRGIEQKTLDSRLTDCGNDGPRHFPVLVGVARCGIKDSGLRLSPEWRLMVSAIYEIPAALLKTLDSGTVRNIVAALLISLPHGMTAPRAGGGKAGEKKPGLCPGLG